MVIVMILPLIVNIFLTVAIFSIGAFACKLLLPLSEFSKERDKISKKACDKFELTWKNRIREVLDFVTVKGLYFQPCNWQ